MTIRTRLAKLESNVEPTVLSLAMRAWLGELLSPAERKQAAIEAAQPIPPVNWDAIPEEVRTWLQR